MIYISHCSNYYMLLIEETFVAYFCYNKRALGPTCLKTRLKLDLRKVGLESELEACWLEVAKNSET